MTRDELQALTNAGTITQHEADALWLHDTKGLSLRQIALGQNVSHTTIHSRLQSARRKLAERKAA